MRSTEDELRSFAHQRVQLAGELLGLLVVGAALLILAPEVDRAGPEPQAVFFCALAIYAVTLLRITPRMIPVLLFRCPRCTQHFHAASRGARPAVSLRRCAHCGIQVPRADSSPA